MDAGDIKIILSAIKYKSFSKAAEEISYTPSAISHIADKIEKELGVKILERTPLGISLSKEGEALYEYMRRVVEAERVLILAAQGLTKSKQNHLRIGTFSSISQNILPEIIGEFRRKYPEIKISVAVEDNLHNWLERDLADIVFTDELSYGDNMWLPIMKDSFIAVVPTDMFEGRSWVSREELYRQTYISINEKILDNYFDKSKFVNILEFESVDNVSVLYMVKQGLGFSVLPRLMLNKKIAGVKTVRLKEPVCRTLGVAYKKDEKLTRATKLFIDYLTAAKKEKKGP